MSGSDVAVSKILVTGISGAGKSAVLVELGRRGYRVVDTDEPGWREYRAHPAPPLIATRGPALSLWVSRM